jgi:predicted secreted protein
MDIAGGIVVYILLWWWVFFMALPVGVQRKELVDLGHDAGAPVQTHLWKKVFATSIISFVLWLGVNWVVSAELISFREMAKTL